MKNIKNRRVNLKILALWFSFLACSLLSAKSTKAQSGIYGRGRLLIAVNPEEKTLTGFFEDHTGWDENTDRPRFSCIFYFAGKLNDGDTIVITSWASPTMEEKIEGALTFSQDKGQPGVKIKLENEHGGCSNVQHFTDEDVVLHLDSVLDWKEIRLVKSEKAFFYDHPDLQDRRNAYVVKGDVLKIYEIKNGWVKAAFGQKEITIGWIKEEDTYKGN